MKRLAFAIGLLLLVQTSLAQEEKKKDKPTGVVVDEAKRIVIIDAKIAPRKLPNLDQIYPIELIASWGAPKGKKAHEIVVSFDINPSDVHKALEKLGLKPGKPAKGEPPKAGDPFPKAAGPIVNVYFEIPDGAGGTKRVSMEKALLDPKTKKPPPKMTFIFTGSVMTAPDPTKPDEKKYGADLTGSLISLFPVTDETVLQTAWTMEQEKYLKLEVNTDVMPKEGTAVKLIIEVPEKK
jgi:hypothetical protein